MSKKTLTLAAALAFSLSAGQVFAQKAVESTAVTCADLNWSAEVLELNPDIAESCRAVYERNGELFAQVAIEVSRVRGNRMSFRPIHTDGTMGTNRTVTLPSDWRATIAGREFRASSLLPGQRLNVYLPEDRFALSIGDDDAYVNELLVVETVTEEVEMPTTASPLFLIGLAGGGFLAAGAALTALRRRKS